MKKLLSLIAIVALISTLTSCKTNMRRDAKLLAHKTEQCFSLVDENNQTPEDMEKFNKCYEKMEKMMNKFDNKYKDEQKSKEFSELYMEEVRKTNLSQDVKNTFEAIYSLADE